VPGRPGRGGPHPAHALLGDLDRVDGLVAEPEGEAADLAERELRPHLVRVLLDQPAAPGRAAGLLVGDGGEDHIAPERPSEPGQEPDDHGAHGDHVLHVDRAAAPDVAVGQLRRERRVTPPPGLGRDHVDVPVEQQRALVPGLGGPEPHDQVGPARPALQHLRLEPVGPEPVGQERDTGGLVAGRVGGVEPDQVAQQPDRGGALALPVDLVQQLVHGASGMRRTCRRMMAAPVRLDQLVAAHHAWWHMEQMPLVRNRALDYGLRVTCGCRRARPRRPAI
jgi:hypothetical protein